MTDTAVKSRDLVVSKIKEPCKYKVIFFNDDVTPMEFVIALLMSMFKHSESSAINVTMQIHNEGAGIAGIYTYEIAEQKAIDATAVAKTGGYPLVIKVEEE
jgi:ATP-dependent Clp protease adaptor protein ClpS